MAEDTQRLLRETTIDGVLHFQCIACDATWTNARGPEHHVRCRIGNLQVLVKMLMRERDDLRKHLLARARTDRGAAHDGALVDWRAWARRLIGRRPSDASDASLRFRLEERMSPTASSTERALRVRVEELEQSISVIAAAKDDLESMIARGLSET